MSTRLSVRLLSVGATALALSAASVTVASAAPRATITTSSKVTLKIASVKPRIYHGDAISGTTPTWAKTVSIQRRVHGKSTWTTAFKDTVTKGKYKDEIDFGLDNYDIRAVVDAVGKNGSIATKPVEIKPTALEYDSPTLTGTVKTPAIPTGDAVFLSYSYNCPAATTAHAFGLDDLIGGNAQDVVDDGGSGVSGSGSGVLETDGQLFGVEGIGLSTCTWSVEVLY